MQGFDAFVVCRQGGRRVGNSTPFLRLSQNCNGVMDDEDSQSIHNQTSAPPPSIFHDQRDVVASLHYSTTFRLVFLLTMPPPLP